MDAMNPSANVLIQRLLTALPELRPAAGQTYRECAAEGLGDDAAQIFLDEYTRGLLTTINSGGPDADAAATRFAALARVLDGEYGLDREADTVIETCFLALLPGPGSADAGSDAGSPSPVSGVLSLLGPRLAALLGAERSWRAEPFARAFVQRMVAALPVVGPDAQGNRYGDHGDVLTQMFLADVARRVADDVASGAPGGLDEARAIVAFLESEFGADPAVDNPIQASFIENLPWPDEPGADVVQLLGPKLRAELGRQRG